MPTQLEVFEDRCARIRGMTSDATIASESYLNDMAIMLRVVEGINALSDQNEGARCVLCHAPGEEGHRDDCPLTPLYAKYTGLSIKLPHPNEENRRREAPWDTQADRDAVAAPLHNGTRTGAARPEGQHNYSTRARTGPRPASPYQGPAGRPRPSYKGWVDKDSGTAFVELLGPAPDVEAALSVYLAGGWEVQDRHPVYEDNSGLMALVWAPVETARAFIFEQKAREAAGQPLV